MAVRRFKFDNSVSLDSSLSYTFTRNVPTVNPAGTAVASDVPRYENANVSLSAVLPVGTVSMTPSGPVSVYVLGAGFDQNGQDELLVFLNLDHGKLRVYYGGYADDSHKYDTALSVISTTSGTGSAQAGGCPSALSVFTTNPTNLGSTKKFSPAAAAVFHGAIVVAGRVFTNNGSDLFNLTGWAFVVSQDKGQTWQLIWEDTNIPQPNHWRGREWVLKVACPYQRTAANPTIFWIVCTDYRSQSTQQGMAQPDGGHVYLIKMTRPNATTNWAANLPNGSPFIADFPKGVQTAGIGCHAHSAHLVEFKASESVEANRGLQLIVSLGDFQTSNRTARLSHNHWLQSDYTTGWSTFDNTHGKRSTASDNPGTWGTQPVGVAIGPQVNQPQVPGATSRLRSTLIWGVDEQTPWITQMVLPETGDAIPFGAGPQAWFEHLYGFATGYGTPFDEPQSQLGLFVRHRALVFMIHERAPGSGGPLAAVLSDNKRKPESDPRLVLSRILYCPSSNTPDKWVPVASLFGTEPGTAAIYGGKVYFSAFGATDSQGVGRGLMYVDIPANSGEQTRLLTGRSPMLVACGGTNLLVQGCFFDPGTQATVTNLSGSAPNWSDGSTGLASVPSLGDHAARLTAATTQTGSFLARLHFSGTSSSQWDQTPNLWPAPSTSIRRLRGWILDGSFLTVVPSKTLSLNARAFNAAGAINALGAPALYPVRGRWSPLTAIGIRTIATANDGFGIEIQSDFYAGGAPDDNRFYFVPDVALDGAGSLSYALVPRDPNNPPPSPSPDELLTIQPASSSTLLSRTTAWTFRISGIHPIGNWDQYAERGAINGQTGDARFWPLLTLWGDANNYIEFVANCVTRGFRVVVKASGTTNTHEFGSSQPLWLPDSQLFVAISHDGSGHLSVGASLGGSPVDVVSGGSFPIDASFTVDLSQLRFRGVAGGVSGEGEVNEYRWNGGEFSDSSTNSTAMASAFADLGFLAGP